MRVLFVIFLSLFSVGTASATGDPNVGCVEHLFDQADELELRAAELRNYALYTLDTEYSTIERDFQKLAYFVREQLVPQVSNTAAFVRSAEVFSASLQALNAKLQVIQNRKQTKAEPPERTSAIKQLAHDLRTMVIPESNRVATASLLIQLKPSNFEATPESLLLSVEQTLMDCAKTASSFHQIGPEYLPEWITIATIIEHFKIGFPVNLDVSTITEEQKQFFVETDLASAKRSIMGLAKNALEAFEAKYVDQQDTRKFHFHVSLSFKTLSELPTSDFEVDEATKTGQKMLVFAPRNSENGYLVVTLNDNAGGIPLHLFPKLFTEQVSSHATPGRGTGMGSVAQQMKYALGLIHLETDPAGTQTQLFFPSKSEKPAITSNARHSIVLVSNVPQTLDYGSEIIKRRIASMPEPEQYAFHSYVSRNEALAAAVSGKIATPLFYFLDDNLDTAIAIDEFLAQARRIEGAAQAKWILIESGDPFKLPLPIEQIPAWKIFKPFTMPSIADAFEKLGIVSVKSPE